MRRGAKLCGGALAIFTIACGARTSLETEASATSPSTADAGSCGTRVTLATSMVLDAPTSVHEPESPVHVVWNGHQLFVVRSDWENGTDDFELSIMSVSEHALTMTATTTIRDVGAAFDVRAAWDGSALGVLWTADAGDVILERYGPDGQIVAPRKTIVPANGEDPTPLALVSDPNGYAFAWGVHTQQGDFETRLGIFGVNGDRLFGPTSLLRTTDPPGGGASIVEAGGGIFATWTMPATQPVYQTSLASLSPQAALLGTQIVDMGPNRYFSGLAFDGTTLDVAIYDADAMKATVVARDVHAAGLLENRPAVADATSGVVLANDSCGRLVMLVPTGQFSSENPIPNGLTFRVVSADGASSGAVVLPVGHQDVESYEVIPAADGFIAAWLEGDQDPSTPSRALSLAYVTVK